MTSYLPPAPGAQAGVPQCARRLSGWGSGAPLPRATPRQAQARRCRRWSQQKGSCGWLQCLYLLVCMSCNLACNESLSSTGSWTGSAWPVPPLRALPPPLPPSRMQAARCSHHDNKYSVLRRPQTRHGLLPRHSREPGAAWGAAAAFAARPLCKPQGEPCAAQRVARSSRGCVQAAGDGRRLRRGASHTTLPTSTCRELVCHPACPSRRTSSRSRRTGCVGRGGRVPGSARNGALAGRARL